jgi:hypothetical protein
MTKPTQGPWTIEEAEDGSAYIVETSPRYQACIVGGDGTALADVRLSDLRIKRSLGEARANAHLMASAPDLLAAGVLALHKIQETLEGQYPDGAALAAAVGPLRAAIAKARGEKPTRE